ncbi:MAG: hypothetical protein H7138_12000 [Myxococcales bacterium]|nr:hypothetical protein [Myxococcales bacterium]
MSGSKLRMLSILPILLGLTAVAWTQVSGADAQPATSSSRPEFTILIYEAPTDLAARTDPARADAYWSSYDAFAAALAKAGVLRGGSALSERVARTVKGKGGADRAVEGARLGGYFVIQAADLDAAVAWSLKAPANAVAVEVRPHRPNPHMAAMTTR